MRRALALLAVVAAGVLFAAAPASARYYTQCPVSGVMAKGNLEAHEVGCGKARTLILGFMDESVYQEANHLYVDGYLCQDVQLRTRPGIVCRRGDRSARFLGSPNV